MAERIVVNTGTLAGYAARINAVKSRIDSLYYRVRQLYNTGEVSGLYYLAKTNRLLDPKDTLEKCKAYINDTVSDFETVERYFTNANPLDFHPPSGGLISIIRQNDHSNSTWKNVQFSLADLVREKYISKLLGTHSIGDIEQILKGSVGNVPQRKLEQLLLVITGAAALVYGGYYNMRNDESTVVDNITGATSSFGTMTEITSNLYDKTLKQMEAADALKLDGTMGGLFSKLALAGSIAKTSGSAAETLKVFTDDDSTWYDKLSSGLGFAGDGSGLIKDAYSYKMGKTKEVVSAFKGRNQILDTGEKVLETKNAAKIDKASAWLNSISIVLAAGETGVAQYGESTEDGDFDLGDAASVGMAVGCGGLSEVVSIATWGVVEFDPMAAVDRLESKTDQVLAENEGLRNYLGYRENTLTNNMVTRGVAAIGTAGYIMVDSTVEFAAEKIGDVCDTVTDRAIEIASENEAVLNYLGSTENTWTNNMVTRGIVATGISGKAMVDCAVECVADKVIDVGSGIVNGVTEFGGMLVDGAANLWDSIF